jgi:glycine/D-amino acid oxidase-like deaminating enzyme
MLASASTTLRPPDDIAEESEVLVEDGRLILGGTLDVDDHQRVVRPQVIQNMWNELASKWPSAADIAVEYGWACFRPAHPNRVPVIDRIPRLDNAWFTSGHYKTGILLAAATGRALADWIRTDSPPDEIKRFGIDRVFAAHTD